MLVLIKKNQSGFSLIELMITVVVLAITVSIAVPSFRSFIVNAQIRSTAESIRNGLQVARAEAIKRNANISFTLSNNTSWSVDCPTCNPTNIQAKPAKEGSSSTITLAITGANNISFTSLGTATAAIGQLSQVNVDDSSLPAAQTKDLSITIGTGGNIRVCDPNISATTDSRHC